MPALHLNFILIVFSLCLIVTALQPNAGQAQTSLQTSTAKAVAFSFYKTAGATPNFERWVKNIPPYTNTPMAKRDAVLQQQKDILKKEFELYDAQKDLLVMRTVIHMDLKLPKEGDETAHFTFVYDKAQDDDETAYFPFSFGGDHFAVVVNEINSFKSAEVPVQQYGFLKGVTGNGRNLHAVFQLRPKKSDTAEPYEQGGREQWLLATDVASLTLWTRDSRLLYEYTAPWYFSPLSLDISPLKDEKALQDTAGQDHLAAPAAQ